MQEIPDDRVARSGGSDGDMRVRMLAHLGLPEDSDVLQEVSEILPGEDGQWILWTLSGSIYLIRMSTGRRELTRLPRHETVWISDDTGLEVQIDGRPLPLVELVEARPGWRGRFRVDSGQPGREDTPLNSTPVVAIVKITSSTA